MVDVMSAAQVGHRKGPDGKRRLDRVDVHVGARLKLRRRLLGLSQSALAERVGLTFQQIQKYERGHNGIAAARLWGFANALDVPLSFFFDGLSASAVGSESSGSHSSVQVLGNSESRELVQCYYRIANPLIRKHLFALVKVLAANGQVAISGQPDF